jgi:hypothetical protein
MEATWPRSNSSRPRVKQALDRRGDITLLDEPLGGGGQNAHLVVGESRPQAIAQ